MTGAPDEVAANGADRDFRRPTALVVDPSATARRVLTLLLARWNFEVLEAADGNAALAICRGRAVDFVICDRAMPGLSGPALCRAIRALPLAHHVYLILLTARSDRDAVAEGLEAGADDFLAMPPDPAELHARLRAGERILAMQEDLLDKNRRLTDVFDRLSMLSEAAERDLRAAARLQRALVPPAQSRRGGVGIGALWRPAGQVGGELVGVVAVSATRLAAYAIDVRGHGVAAALTAARLARLLAPGGLDESPAVRRLPNGAYVPRDPAGLAADLDRRRRDEGDDSPHFTMLFADVDVSTGLVRFVRAGHPPPAVIRPDGTVEFPGADGAPVGLHPDAVWETETVRLDPGDRLALLSDGVTGCANPRGETFARGLADVLAATRHLSESAQLNELLAAMERFAGGVPSGDDISALILTMP